MWTQLEKCPLYHIKLVRERQLHIMVTDYIRIWEAFYSENDLITCLKESNDGLEMDLNELLEKGNKMLTCPNDLESICVLPSNSRLEITMLMLCGFPFNLKILLYEGSPELFFKNVTQPAIRTVDDLRRSEKQLRLTLITKDDEIEQYKKLGGKIKYTAIPAYNDEAHMKKHNAFEENFGDTDISEDLLTKEVSLPSENVIKQEAIDEVVKTEPTTQSTDNTKNENEVATIKAESIKTETKVIKNKKERLQIKRKKLNI
ncbi:unnamed protein product [Danaus chrysippus]|uniref:(African queen) hypothetical protein n=1 Tax=Danaus chrysippus TaxID=151541 RepID=A0A8J2QEK2_9NEOP|nr:unnamed protein product [Danaus chrysippus]